jgi:hypothetical protein
MSLVWSRARSRGPLKPEHHCGRSDQTSLGFPHRHPLQGQRYLVGSIRSVANREGRASSVEAARASDIPSRIDPKPGAAETGPQSMLSALRVVEPRSLKGRLYLRSQKSGSNLPAPAKNEAGTWLCSIACFQPWPRSRNRRPDPTARRQTQPAGLSALSAHQKP